MTIDLVGICDGIRFGALLELGVALSDAGRRWNPALWTAINIAAAHLIAGETDSVAEPLAGNENWHLEAETNLGMEEGTYMVVLGQIGEETAVLCGEVGGFFIKRYAGAIHNSQIGAEHLQALDEADAVGQKILDSSLLAGHFTL